MEVGHAGFSFLKCAAVADVYRHRLTCLFLQIQRCCTMLEIARRPEFNSSQMFQISIHLVLSDQLPAWCPLQTLSHPAQPETQCTGCVSLLYLIHAPRQQLKLCQKFLFCFHNQRSHHLEDVNFLCSNVLHHPVCVVCLLVFMFTVFMWFLSDSVHNFSKLTAVYLCVFIPSYFF